MCIHACTGVCVCVCVCVYVCTRDKYKTRTDVSLTQTYRGINEE